MHIVKISVYAMSFFILFCIWNLCGIIRSQIGQQWVNEIKFDLRASLTKDGCLGMLQPVAVFGFLLLGYLDT